MASSRFDETRGLMPPARQFAGQRQHARRLQVPQTSLCVGGELSQRLDFVAEQLQPIRIIGVGGKNVEDAAAAGEVAGQLDRVHPLVAMFDQPG